MTRDDCMPLPMHCSCRDVFNGVSELAVFWMEVGRSQSDRWPWIYLRACSGLVFVRQFDVVWHFGQGAPSNDVDIII